MEQHIFDILKNELNVRLDKQWKIFSWTSTILITIAGGIITLEAKNDLGFEITSFDRTILTLIICTLSTYAYRWINQNIKLEDIVREKLNVSELENFGARSMNFGYVHVIWALSVFALLAVWVKSFC